MVSLRIINVPPSKPTKRIPTKYIERLEVVYTDDESNKPEDAVEEIFVRNSDINRGFGGKFVWLVPVYTQDRKKACSGFKLIIEKKPGTGTAKWYKNLSKGTMTGSFRYLASTYPENKIFSPSSISELRVTKVVLIRKNLNGQEDGGFWDGRTGDINEGRLGFGDYLYLAWSLA